MMGNFKKLICFLGIGFCFWLLFTTVVQRPERTDLGIVLGAADRLQKGESVYRLTDANEHTKPPLATLLFVPLLNMDSFALERIWDGINILLFLALATFLATRLPIPKVSPWWLVFLSMLFLLNQWNTEVRMGQYNLICYALVLFACFSRQSFVSGVLICLALLLKPTFILFLPWILRFTPKPKQFLIGGTAMLSLLAFIYQATFQSLTADHLTWYQFISQSTAKHLSRVDNYGLPSQLAIWFEGGNFQLPCLLFAFSIALVIAIKVVDKMVAINLLTVLCIVLSPMAWRQNYVLLIGFVQLFVFYFYKSNESWEKLLCLGSLLTLYLGWQLYNPTTSQLFPFIVGIKLPLWTLLFSVTLFSLRGLLKYAEKVLGDYDDCYAWN